MKKNNLDKYWEKIFTNWQVIEEFEKDYMIDLSSYLKKQKFNKKIIYPNGNKIFNAFKLTKFEDVKVVILGQDPYHGPGQAHSYSTMTTCERRERRSVTHEQKGRDQRLGEKLEPQVS